MNRLLPLVPLAGAALLVPSLIGGRPGGAHASAPVPRAHVLAAVQRAEAQREAANLPKAAVADAAADLDRMAGAAGKIDPNRIDPKIALGALAR